MLINKTNRVVLGVSFLVAVFVWMAMRWYRQPARPPVWHSKVYTVNSGWGYDIYKRGTLYIQQPFMPVVAGKQPFANKAQANKAADMVIEKLNKGQLPVLAKDEITLILSFAE